MTLRSLARSIAAVGAATALAIAAPLAASAHVRVSPDQAAAGSYAVLTFQVPTESNTASTVKVEVDLPAATPFTSVSYQPVAGWTTEVVTTTLKKPVKIPGATITEAPTKVIWTAQNGEADIKPEQFQQFAITAGIVPDTGSVMLPARQTYSDGSIVDWDQKAPASGVEPGHPAPVLYINDAPPTVAAGSPGPTVTRTAPATQTAAPGGTTNGSTSQSASSTDTDGLGVWLGLVALVLAAIALVLSVFALTHRRRAIAAGAEYPAPAAPRASTPRAPTPPEDD